MAGLFSGRIRTVNSVGMKSKYNDYRFLIWFFTGIIVGSLCINVFCDYFYDKLGIYSSYFLDTYKNVSVDKKNLFLYSIKDLALEILMVFGISFTSFGGIFLNLYCGYKGMVIALLVASSVLKYGIGGVLIYVISIFPHYITYGIMIVLLVMMGHYIWEKMKLFRKSRCMGTGLFDSFRMLMAEMLAERKVFVVLIIIMGLGLLTSLMEVYINSSLIKKII